MGFSAPTLCNPKYLRPILVREAYIRQAGENRYYCPKTGAVLYIKWGRDADGANAMFTVPGPGSTIAPGIQCQQATRDSYLAYNDKDPETEPKSKPVVKGGGKKASWAGKATNQRDLVW